MSDLDDEQRDFLAELATRSAATTPAASGDDWQSAIFAVRKEAGLPAGRAFDAIYRAFLGRPTGREPGGYWPGLSRRS